MIERRIRVLFNLIHTSSRPKYTVRTTMTSTDSEEFNLPDRL